MRALESASSASPGVFKRVFNSVKKPRRMELGYSWCILSQVLLNRHVSCRSISGREYLNFCAVIPLVNKVFDLMSSLQWIRLIFRKFLRWLYRVIIYRVESASILIAVFALAFTSSPLKLIMFTKSMCEVASAFTLCWNWRPEWVENIRPGNKCGMRCVFTCIRNVSFSLAIIVRTSKTE